MRARGYLAFFVGVCLTASACYYVTEEQQKLQVQDSFKRDTEKVARDTQTRLVLRIVSGDTSPWGEKG